MILNTADYCYATCNQLEERIKARIDEDLRANVDLQNQADAFMGIASAAVRAVVKKVEIDIEHVWREMRNMPWSTMENVGDSSSYVTEMLRIIKTSSSTILKYIQKQQYSRAFCDNLIETIAASYIANIGRCKPVSETGAEQMLLDSYVLRKGLLEIPNVNNEEQPPPQPSAAFIKRATQSMSKIDALLKTLQVRPSPPEALVQAYLIHIADRSEANFKKLLELKGTARKDQNSLVDLFNAHAGSPTYANLPLNGPLLSTLQITNTKDSTGPLSSTAAGSRFDASTFGSAIMNAAKEGVDRFGSPGLGLNNPSRASLDGVIRSSDALGVGGTTLADGQASSAAASTTNLNDNLQKIGKFFRRDTGFGARFGKGSG